MNDFNSKWTLRLSWQHGWALGYCKRFSPLGIAYLQIGPLLVRVTWPVDESALGVSQGT